MDADARGCRYARRCLATVYPWVLAAVSLVGCDTGKSVEDAFSVPTNTIDFAGKRCSYIGQVQAHLSLFRFNMITQEYGGDSPSTRLLELIQDDRLPSAEQDPVFARLLQVQRRRGDRWVNDGPGESCLRDGSRDESYYRDGKRHGVQQIWWPNGKLRREENYAFDQLDGRSREWYESGDLQFDSVYMSGQEVAGKGWDRNGDPIEYLLE